MINFIALLFLFNIIFAIILIFVERRNPSVIWAWLMILTFLPGVGFILYLFVGQNLRRQNTFKRKSNEEDLIEQFISKQIEILNTPSSPLNQEDMENHMDLVRFNLKSNNSVYTENNSVEFYNDGNDKFKQMFQDIENAKTFIHIEYYIIAHDSLTEKLFELLVRKAKEGVEVKVLGDGMGCRQLHKHFFDELKNSGGKVAIFFPPFVPYVSVRINYRNHRKICIVDGEHAYIGGFNIGTEYLGQSKKFGNWRDAHVRITGEAIDSLQLRFFMDWRFAAKDEVPFDLKYFPVHKRIENGIGIQIMASGPDTRSSAIKNMYFKLINEAEKSLYIQTPYFVPDESILAALKIAALSGVDVRIIIPNIPDHPFIYWVNRSYAGELLDTGVKFYYYQKGFIHSKMIIADGIICSVGTANMDIRSFETNFEVTSVLYNKQLAESIQKKFMLDLEDSIEITKEFYAARGMMSNIKESISRLLSPLL